MKEPNVVQYSCKETLIMLVLLINIDFRISIKCNFADLCFFISVEINK